MVADRFPFMTSRLLVLVGLCVVANVLRSALFHESDAAARGSVDDAVVPPFPPAVASFDVDHGADAGGLSGQFFHTAGSESPSFCPSVETVVLRALGEPGQRGFVCAYSSRWAGLVGNLSVIKNVETSAKSRNAPAVAPSPVHQHGLSPQSR